MDNKDFFIDKDGFKLHAKLDFPAGFDSDKDQAPVVILQHGYTGHMEERHIRAISEAATECGYVVLRTELYGHGKSDGTFANHNVAEWVLELAYIVDYARALPFAESVGIMGHSQGGLAVILAAGLKADQLKFLVPLAPAIMIRDMCVQGTAFGGQVDVKHIPDTFTTWDGRVLTGNYMRVNALLPVEQMIDAYEGPVFFVHGTADEAVPVSCTEEAVKRYKNARVVWIPGDTHCYEHHLEMVCEAVKEFLTEMKSAG